ncbi:FliC/FljB family flagellin [Scandinavium sp.]|uniref:FliC/FljB family flagellin n=1 Tax=Scandinavium sp. TaxID=2830653 RepID=UPI002898FDBB|nr:FliC/FljB family flagellin [Scandinavium sp.]
MAQVINTNALSLVAQNNLNKSQSSLGTAIQRLSSGVRINSAKDDAAGQAIANRFTANISGLTQASRNANDGISIAQTTEGALNEINDNLQNIRRLTVQSQNGTNSDSDRKSIQDEIDARLSEINRISEQTEFNGVKVLSKDQTLSIQVGSNDGQTINIDLSKIDASTLSMDSFDATKVATKVAKGSNIDDGTATAKMSAADMDALTTQLKDASVTGIAGDNAVLYQHTDDTGATKFYAVGDKGAVEMTAVVTPADDATSTPSSVAFTAGADALTADEMAAAGLGQLQTIDDALAQVDELRSGLGAVQNRFDSVISNLNSTVNNLSESRSRIQDADFASEVSNMSRANILQSAGTTVLAQANQVPQNVLSLLR